MKKVENIKTGVIKELKSEVELSMYLATGEWKIVDKKEKTKPLSQKSE